MNAKLLPLLAVSFWLSGCVVDTGHTAVQYDSSTVELEGAESVQVNLEMGAGELRVTDGSQKLMRADFSYNIGEWKPKVQYEHAAKRGTLTVSQPGTHHTHLGNTRYQWDLQLNNKVPMDLKVNFGAGDARLDVGSLDLRSVEIDMGVGKLVMDLHGKPKQDYEVHVNGGVGEATIKLPSDVGIWAEASGGIGAINVHGLRKEGSHWESDTIGRSKVKIRVNVQGGIGAVNLIAD